MNIRNVLRTGLRVPGSQGLVLGMKKGFMVNSNATKVGIQS